jgi:prephenate dehydrogenase
MIQRLCVIGVGLIGGSLARSLRSAGAVGSVIGCGRGQPNLEAAMRLGVIDEFTSEPAAAVAGADMVVVATTLGATGEIFDKIAPAISSHAIVTDVGSAKQRVIDLAKISFADAFPRFVPGHPIAGTEQSGVEASFAELFRDHQVILTPAAQTDPAALAEVEQMWCATGAIVTHMQADQHDKVLAATSHIPHMLAYALVECLASTDKTDNVFNYAAGGFRDFTRIASSSPEMWRDIALDNRAALLRAIGQFQTTFADLRTALEREDGDALRQMFSHAKSVRDRALTPRSK